MNQHPLTDKNRLSIVNPKLCKEWDYEKNYPLRPEDVSPGSNKKIYWICKEKHSYKTSLSNRSSGKGCPYCSGRLALSHNCLLAKYPELAKQWHPTKNGKLTPRDVLPKSDIEVWWVCEKNHIWKRSIFDRTRIKSKKCPLCSSLAFTDPKLSSEWHPIKNGDLTPWDVTKNSNIKVWWQCNKKQEWLASINGRKYSGKCPCHNGTTACGKMCLLNTNPKLALEWHPTKNGKLTPRDVLPCSNKRVWWLCKKGHQWATTINDRNGGNGCPYCNKILLKDGTSWDSYVEAYAYLKFKKRGIIIEPHKKYGFGRFACDFYLPTYNTYFEVTSFSKNKPLKYVSNFWKKYEFKINRKKRFVTNKLKAYFRFISIEKFNRAQKNQVIREMT